MNLPSAHLSLGDQLEICRAARDAARRGIGVVVTHGTDTLEETAMLCDVLHDAEAPIVFTGAIRPPRPPGADGPANLSDAVSVAASEAAAGHRRARLLRRRDPPRAHRAQDRHHLAGGVLLAPDRARSAASPRAAPRSGRGCRATRRSTRPTSNARADRAHHRGDDGTLARAALDTEPDGAVIGTLGAGHLAPPLLDSGREVAERIPVVAYCRAERGVILNATYGYPGSERDLRGSGIIPAGFLSPQAARMKLLACLASGLSIDEVRWAFRQDDG